MRTINPFLNADQLTEVIRRITNLPHASLIKNNQHVLSLLLENTSVSKNHQTGEKKPIVRYIDFQALDHNNSTTIHQLKVCIPGNKNNIMPDIILFLNGLPVAVIECKSTKVKEPIAEAIDQLLRYSQQRDANGEGNPSLFYYNQSLVATCRTQAKFGTLTTYIEKHWFRWSDTYPMTLNDLAHKATSSNDQQRLIAGMCAKQNLPDLLQSFTFLGPMIKSIPSK